MIYYFIVGVSTCNRKTNDQDNDGNIKRKQFSNIFQIIVLLNFFHLKHSIKKTNENLQKIFRDNTTDNT